MNTMHRIGLVFLVFTQLGFSGIAQSGGMITTVAGNGTVGYSGDGGPATLAQLTKPVGVAVDSIGNLYIAEEYGRIRKVTPDGIISTVAGNGTESFSGDGGPATSAQLYNPAGIDVDTAGNLYIADFNNRRIRKVTPEGVISTVAGGSDGGIGTPATSLNLAATIDVVVDRADNVYFSESWVWDNEHELVRKVTPDGEISTVAGGGTREIPGDGVLATSIQFNGVGGVTVDFAGNLYITDYTRVYKLTPDGLIRIVAGNGTAGYSGDGGPATAASVNGNDIAVDFTGNLYIAEGTRIRKVTPDGVINTVAGNGTQGYSGDGGTATYAQLNLPRAIAVDLAGSLYVADTGNNRVRKVESIYAPQSQEFLVPIVLSAGGMNGSWYTSEMTLANRGDGHAIVNFAYTASLGNGTGTGIDTLAPGEQKIVPDAISYLRTLGVPIPLTGSQGGTLRVSFSGLSSPADSSVIVRTTTAVVEGKVGLAFPGIPTSMVLTGPSYICGLRQNLTDRSNIALQHAGTAEDGNISLRLTVFSGVGGTETSTVLADRALPPGGFSQISGILHSNGLLLNNGYVKVERVSGTAPYYAYGVINDQYTSDGSFIPPMAESAHFGKTRMILPVVVETKSLNTELVVTNWSTTMKSLDCRFVSDNVSMPDATASFRVDVNPFEQLIWPELVQKLRDSQIPGIDAKGLSFAGVLLISVPSGDLSGISVAARTSMPGLEGRYGVYYAAIPEGSTTTSTAWLYGLQQNSENRTNLALVNTGETDNSVDTFRIELFNGDTGSNFATVDGINLAANRWVQMNMLLSEYTPGVTQGYARVTRTAGNNPFIAYAVINDGSQPGKRTGDGSFVASSP